MKIIAKVRTKECASEPFSVRTWPVKRVVAYCAKNSSPVDYTLMFQLEIESESGNFDDLHGLLFHEKVDYLGNNSSVYYPPHPPYALCSLDDPHIPSGKPLQEMPTFFDEKNKKNKKGKHTDYHRPFCAFAKGWFGYRKADCTADQEYYFSDPVLVGATIPCWIDLDRKKIAISGPYEIRREVTDDSGVWKYKITKGVGRNSCMFEWNLP